MTLPKSGNSDHEFEDALSIRNEFDLGQTSYFAVADGATESPYSGLWARLLAKAFTDGAFDRGIDDLTLAPLRAKWISEQPGGDVPWYLEQKLEEGAFAALAGIRIDPFVPAKGKGWARITAVGDCCAFRFRGVKMEAFPLTHSSSFTSRPFLLGTVTSPIKPNTIQETEWTWKAGDRFLLTSDAIASSILRYREEQVGQNWLRFFDEPDTDDIINEINDHRLNGGLRNDDIVVIAIEITNS